MMPLRQVLEQIWNDATVRCPRHIVWWFHLEGMDPKENLPRGHQQVNDELDLFFAKGERVDLPKRKRHANE